jgi:hypothetical protein
VGSVLVLVAAAAARSVALAGFGLDSLIEIVASAVVVWQLKGAGDARERKALRVIGIAFVLLALYIGAQSIYVLAAGFRPHQSRLGIAWLALTALAMFALADGKSRTGQALGNRVLQTEARVTVIDGVLAFAVLAGLVLNAAFGWWWADPLAAFVIVYYGLREGRGHSPFEPRLRGSMVFCEQGDDPLQRWRCPHPFVRHAASQRQRRREGELYVCGVCSVWQRARSHLLSCLRVCDVARVCPKGSVEEERASS